MVHESTVPACLCNCSAGHLASGPWAEVETRLSRLTRQGSVKHKGGKNFLRLYDDPSFIVLTETKNIKQNAHGRVAQVGV